MAQLWVPILVLILVNCLRSAQSYVNYESKMRHSEYDYIVVGAGSAGAVVASRLSEDPENRVLLLEAGGPPHGISEIPFILWETFHTEMDWEYYTEPQENACLGITGQRAYFPRGKALGGSSVMNAMMYVRGNHRDFDEWARGGATGWSWDDVFHYFKKSENNTDPTIASNGYHGTGGHQTISSSSYITSIRDAIFGAANQLGYETIDCNGPSQTGVTLVQATVRDGLRCSTEKAFLHPAVHRPNLDILVYAHVTKVLVDNDKRATAVQFDMHNVSHVVRSRKEIVLSAGAIGSPQILMLSGIGPKEHLQELGIPLVQDLPVGQNLQDHITHGGQLFLLDTNDALVQSRIWNYRSVGELIRDGGGPLSVPGGNEAMLFLNTKYQDPSLNWPDIQISFASTLYLPTINKEVEEFLSQYRDRDALSIFPWLNRPQGRGYIKLRSKDPYEHPIIDPKYLSVEDDLNRLVEGMKFVEELMKTPPMQEFRPVRIPDVVPGCDGIDTDSEDYLKCMARSMTLTVYHQSGTCRMGNPKDPTTVVDPQLRVKGVKGLRVADASIMPLVTTGNTNAPCLMIGEKAADLVLGRAWDSNAKKVKNIEL